ncbi:MAG: hypothetical protein PHQ59_02555 [Candidatus Daviesbacteria bacterium]|nr:hypothetical protein [Candidatus Daviesbacteria bacterium]
MKINKYILILVLGITLRLVLSLSSYHSDVAALTFAGQVITQGHILDFYDYLPNLPQSAEILKVFPTSLFNYPPLVYLLISVPATAFLFLINSTFEQTFIFNIAQAFGDLNLFAQLILFKLPYLVYDLIIALLIMKILQTPKERLLGFALWMFNPVSLYATYMIGQFDIVPTFFVVISLFLVSSKIPITNKRLLFAALMLGFGAAVKIFPLFFLVPVASLTNSWKTRIQIFIVGFSPYILSLLPFIFSKGFRSSALVANQTLKSLYPQIPVSGGESILLFVTLLIFIYIVMLKKKGLENIVWQRYLIAILPFYIFTHFHPQWFIWVTPILIIELVRNRFQNLFVVLIMLFSFIGSLFFYDPGLNINLFAPIIPSLYNGPSIWQILNINIDYNFWRSILQSLFVGAALYYLYLYFPRKDEQ